MSAHQGPHLDPTQRKVIRWAGALVARGEVPTVPAVLAEARAEDAHTNENAVWRARKSLLRRGLFPGAETLDHGPPRGVPAAPRPSPRPRRKRWRRRHEFATDCLKQRQILETMRAYINHNDGDDR